MTFGTLDILVKTNAAGQWRKKMRLVDTHDFLYWQKMRLVDTHEFLC